MKMKKTALFLVIFIALVYGAVQTVRPVFHEGNDTDRATKSNDRPVPFMKKAKRPCLLQVSREGRVISILPDDEKGSRHQRFVIELDSGQAFLVAHNIDAAPRIGTLRSGSRVGFHGEYEWNPQDGVIHRTHRDFSGWHPHGWIVHNGCRKSGFGKARTRLARLRMIYDNSKQRGDADKRGSFIGESETADRSSGKAGA